MSPLWSRIADWILDRASVLLIVICGLTLFLGYWFTQVKTDHRAGRFIAPDAPEMLDFERSSNVFGESQAMLYVVFSDVDPRDAGFLDQLGRLGREIEPMDGVQHVLSLANAPLLERTDAGSLAVVPLVRPGEPPEALAQRIDEQSFLQGLLLSKDGRATVMIVKIEEAFNSTPERVTLVNRVEELARRLPGKVALAGFPYLRTQYARRITTEAPLFTFLALLISLFFLYLTFRSWRAILLPTLIVVLGIVWTIGLVALFGHRLNVVTSILPALIVIIGMANAIHLSTKFYDQYALLGDRRQALHRTIHTVGLATFLTSVTTAIGFGVLMLSGSSLLIVFGAFAAAGIMLLYGLSVVLIPYAYQRLRPPIHRAAALATHDHSEALFDRTATFTRRHGSGILFVSALLTIAGIVGITRIPSDIYVFSDFYEDDPLRKDLAVFEKHFGGILPMEVVIVSNEQGGLRSLGTLRRISSLQDALSDFPAMGRSLSAADLVKTATQAYFGGHPAAYRLPTSYEMPFLRGALSDFMGGGDGGRWGNNLPLLMDSTFTMTRIHLGVPDLGTARMNALADTVRQVAAGSFSPDAYEVFVTGSAVTATRSGENLVTNLFLSLAVALGVISLLMAWLFRSARLTVISLLPNVIPLVLVGGAMGLAGITLKPSTALIFSLAFGIAVDDTIHFLTKYRLLRDTGHDRDQAIRQTLRETGKAILFTSLVLVAGFLVFTLSSFGGTVAMGFLTSLTLAAALLANLFMLPALLYKFGPETHRPLAARADAQDPPEPVAVPMEEG